MGYYAAFLDVTDRRCLVVGGGQPALAKVRGLLESGARVTVVCDRVLPAIRQLDVAVAERRFEDDDVDGCVIVIDASGDEETGVQVSRAAQVRGIPVNVLDRPRLCTFIAPALVRRGPLQIAISTSGRSPFLAAHLRRLIERWVGDEWGDLVERVGTLRDRLRQQAVPMTRQLAAYSRSLGTFGAKGTVGLVGAGPGDPALLTVRATELLSRAELVFYDALVEPAVLDWCRPDAELVPVGKRGGRPSTRQDEIERRMIDAALRGRFVVRLKGGDPFVFGRGGEEVAALTAAGISVEVVPGVSSVVAAPALAGIPLTQRGIAASFAVTTARRADGSLHDFRDLAGVDTLVVMMVLECLTQVTQQLMAAGRAPGCPAALVAAASTARQRVVRGSLATIAEQSRGVTAPALLIVGDVVNVIETARVHELDGSHALELEQVAR
jgi:uroporphyrin-III C-methyltransferase / precorrin-2 dehydrogenase / sirohydrochlorin ferrochelatase